MPRPSALTVELCDRILVHVRRGLHPYRAAQAEGIAPNTYYRWMDNGAADRTDDPPLPQDLNSLRTLAAFTGVKTTRNASKRQVHAALTAAGITRNDLYREFRQRIEQAEADAEAEHVRKLDTQLDESKTPGDRLRFMERRWKPRWAPQTSVELTGADGAPIEVNATIEDRLTQRLTDYFAGAGDQAALTRERETT